MKKIYCLLFIIFFVKTIFAQKKDIYILGKDTVNAERYQEVKKSKLERFYKETSSTHNNTKTTRLIKRYKEGYLSFQQYFFIKKNIERYSNKKIDSTKTILVYYFHENDLSLKKRSSFRKFQNWLNKSELKSGIRDNKNILPFRVYDNQSYIINHEKLLKTGYWVKDSKRIFKKLFFPYKFNFSSFLIIKPDGEYALYYGEYPFDFIISKFRYWNYFDEYLKRGFYINGKWLSFIKK